MKNQLFIFATVVIVVDIFTFFDVLFIVLRRPGHTFAGAWDLPYLDGTLNNI